MVRDELQKLRKVMKENDIQAVIIPTSDFHDTEYVSEYFAARKWFSGFTGSAGTLVVMDEGGALWTDGRYFVQAAKELEGSGLELMKMGMEGTPDIPEYLAKRMHSGNRVALDGRTVSMEQYENWKERLSSYGITLITDLDLVSQAWDNRPAMPAAPVFIYDEKYAGESANSKLKRIMEKVHEGGARAHLTNKIDEIAWALNIRAHDIPSFPAPLSYLLLSDQGNILYINQERVPAEVRDYLLDHGVRLKDYDAVYTDAENVDGKVMMQKSFINSTIGQLVKDPVWQEDPEVLLKACKNPVEQEGFRKAHVRDGVALAHFWYWLENELGKEPVTEISAAEKLQEFRKQQENYMEDSFTTISAYGANAAMPHYHPDESNPVYLQKQGLYLVDSGGHYLDGTTDITRTFVLGDITDEEKDSFTRVLQGHIALAKQKFPYGARGLNLDVLARGPLWDLGLDYNHGTGHGVGGVLNVHEAPNGFRWKIVPERNDSCVLEEGMVTSDEPGYYEEGKYGIRHENLLLTKKAMKTDFGQFMEHEVLTLFPFDVRGLNTDDLSRQEKDWLNAYHARVFEKLSPYLDEKETRWLAEKTRAIS